MLTSAPPSVRLVQPEDPWPHRLSRVERSWRPTLLFLAMGAYVFFLPIQFQTSSVNLAPSDLFLVLGLVLGMGRLRLVKNAWSILHPSLILIFVMGGAVAISSEGMATPFVRIKLVGLGTLFAAYLALTSAVHQWEDIRRILRVFILATALNTLFALAAFAGGFRAEWMNYGTKRVSGMLLDPNAFGGLVMVALVLQLVTQESRQALLKGWLGAVVSITLLAGLVFTLSRSAWIGFAFALATAWIFRPQRALLSVVLVGAVGAGAWLSIGSDDRSIALVERSNTAMQRIDQIREALPMFATSPIFGIGIGGFDKHSDPSTRYPRIIHNTTVWIMTEFGLVGLTVYLGFVGWFFLQGMSVMKRAPVEAKPLILALLCAHAGMLGLSTGIEAFYQRHWWMVMAMLASCVALCRNKMAGQRPGWLQVVR